MRTQIIFFIAGIIFLAGCKEKYDLPLTSSNQSLLVVEGNLTVGGPTTIRLTKTFRLEDTAKVQPVNGAILRVEGKDNSSQPLASSGNGYYESPGLNLLPGNEYRLRIRTIDGKEYLSDYVRAQLAPAIDSISWRRTAEGVSIFANSHDPSNNTKYYRWEYVETWEYHSPYPPNIIYENDNMRPRVFPQEDVSTCWSTVLSSNILLANSLRLESDVISMAPLLSIPEGNYKISTRYSILVKQYALSREAYRFYELLKENTENLGGFFGPMPSEISGNITCISNPNEIVVGFVTASSVAEQRIFINNAEVAPWAKWPGCLQQEVPYHRDSIRFALAQGMLPVYDQFFPPKYVFATSMCVDCRERGGVTTRPAFW
jgi:hypothetical protein